MFSWFEFIWNRHGVIGIVSAAIIVAVVLNTIDRLFPPYATDLSEIKKILAVHAEYNAETKRQAEVLEQVNQRFTEARKDIDVTLDQVQKNLNALNPILQKFEAIRVFVETTNRRFVEADQADDRLRAQLDQIRTRIDQWYSRRPYRPE